MPATVSFDIELVKRALEENLGNILRTARALKIPRSSLMYWIRGSEELREACNQAKESRLDMLESKLLDKAIGDENDYETGDTQAAIFLLKSIGKERGYGDKGLETDKIAQLGQWMDNVLTLACVEEDERRLPMMKGVPPLEYKHPDLPPDGSAKAKTANHKFKGKKKS